ncbi:MAG: bifunctional diguanylate cyclase/phosphodiesterase [Rhodobacteraceae bacterium]|nr:bifunctional diguanylate cyclase/phosphodiesterase [Paracoccaceae bacterium]
MLQTFGRFGSHFLHSVKTALIGPQILAFIPALTLGGFWFGGEGLLLFMAIVLPALLGLVGIFTPMHPARPKQNPVDAITKLPLRDAVISTLDRTFEEESKTGLHSAALALEIDEFAQCRRNHGNAAAERILALVAERIGGTMRTGDIISRIDGSRFAIALAPSRRADLETLIQVSARLQSSIAEPIMLDGLRLFLTASVGFCTPRRASEKSGSVCLEAAECALAEAQAGGTAAIRAYTTQPRRKRVKRAGLVGEVGPALESGQIKPCFQPQVSTDTGQISGMEALARWDHPDRGLILPGAFLPAVSAAAMNERLSEVMLYHSLSALKALDEAEQVVPSVGVNFSNDELSDPRLCDKIRWELDRFDFAPDRLTIEVLETVIARSENDTITRNIARLSEFGCGIDLDDFGTGHASIANIRRFSVGRIKIDRSFITCIDHDRQQQQMLTAILEMAERLGVATLAEGVETTGEHALLAQLGCGHVQGYCIAKPMPLDELAPWLVQHRNQLAAQPKITRHTG